jgi:dihydropteroate synthase
MALYRLVANSRQELRQQIRELPAGNYISSSCYQFGAQWYLLLAQNSADLSGTSLPFSSPPHELHSDSLHAGGFSESSSVSQGENLVWEWATSELTQDLRWLNYEEQAITQGSFAYLRVGETQVRRSFLPLTEIMLIINQTPDSFSDGGKFYQQTAATLAQIEYALQAGVSLIDVGAESTRPGAEILAAYREIFRLMPLLAGLSELKQRYTFKISLDSYKPETVLHFLPLVDIVNDVSGKLPAACLQAIAAAGKTYAFMHSLTIPANPLVTLPATCDPCAEVLHWAEIKRDSLLELGFQPQQLICDPGIGFNKTTSQSWYILRHIAQFHQLGIELLVGHSRKRFLNKVTVNEFAARDIESAATSVFLSEQGIDYLRVHDYQDYLRQMATRNQLSQFRRISGVKR